MVDSPATNPARPSVKPLYLTAAATSALLYASYFPLNLGFLIWVALVPLLFLIRSDARPRHIYLAAYCGGLLFYLPAIVWMCVAHTAMIATWLTLSIYSSLYFPLGLYLIRKLDRDKVPLPLAVPMVWVALEYCRMHFPTGFAWLEPLGVQHRIGFGWYFLGYAQHDCLPIIQIGDIAGVYGVSFLVALVNAVIYLWAYRIPAFGFVPTRRPWMATAGASVIFASTLLYGYWRLDHPPFETGPRVAMLQCNLPQSVKMLHGNDSTKEMIKLLMEATDASQQRHPDLIVWPETTFELDWETFVADSEASKGVEYWRDKRAKFEKVTRVLTHNFRAYHLLGLNALEWESSTTAWKYNSALLVDSNGKVGARYDKMHLVPFGEYVPLRNTFPWMKHFTPYTGDYSCKPGEHWTRFPLAVGDKTYLFGCIICYEDTDPALARRYVQPSPEGPLVDFLINISNDGWFNGTVEHEQHLAICRFRAIECRRSIVRAVNMGISGIVDPDGRIAVLPGPSWSESKKVATVVIANVPIDHRETLFSRWGDWLPIGCWILLIGSLVVAIGRSQKSSG